MKQEKKIQADRKKAVSSSPVMAEIVCAQLPTFSSKHLSENCEDFVIIHITKNIDTYSVRSG